MALRESYAVWNNKGGVGKSTITFHIAARFAELNPNIKILVIDLCPQANASMMLLGGGSSGEANVLTFGTEATPRSVVGYLSNVLAAGAGAPLPDPNDFIVQVNHYNPNLTDNLYLLSGDGNLEPMAPAISGAAAQPPLTPQAQPWKWVHMVFRELVDNMVSNDDQNDWLVLVDTNPSFSIYTELAMCAVNRLITPVNADDSSRVATNAMFILLHGQTPPHPVYGSWTFASRAPGFGIQVPQIHLVVGNRLTQYQGAATAFAALSDATADTLFHAYRSHPHYFTSRSTAPMNLQEFRDLYSVPLRDFNTAGVVAAHLGQRLSNLTGRHYPVHGEQVQLVRDRIEECISAIDTVAAVL